MLEAENERLDGCDWHGKIWVFGEEAVVCLDNADERSAFHGKSFRKQQNTYSKPLPLSGTGMLPTVAILKRGGCPESGGGVVEP